MRSFLTIAAVLATLGASPASCTPHEGHPHPTSSSSSPPPPSKSTSPSTLATRTTTTMPDKCTTRPTQTIFSTAGCAISCPTQINCIADYGVLVPCGCTRVAVRPVTTTICPPNTHCFQCYSGWGIITQYETGCTGSATATATGKVIPTPAP